MSEPVSLFLTLIGTTAGGFLKEAAEKHVESFFGDALKKLAKKGQKRPLAASVQGAWLACGDTVLGQIRGLTGFEADDPELAAYARALAGFVDDKHVTRELLRAAAAPDDPEALDVAGLAAAWNRLGCPDLPPGFSWKSLPTSFRRRLQKQRAASPELRATLDSENLLALTRALAGIQPEGDEGRYAERMRQKYRALDLAALAQPSTEEPGILDLRDAFVPQSVREDPPRLELPKDLQAKLAEEGSALPEGLTETEQEALSAWQLEEAREASRLRPLRPVLETLAEKPSRRVVLLGGPGSGKSTLLRYLLLSVLDAPRSGGKSPPWLDAFRDALPLLVELREFMALYAEKRCDTFLDYLHHLGKVEKYHLDRVWLHDRLRSGPSLVLFDGLDEIFDGAERRRVMQAIVGFGSAYPGARIVVTSRPVGYEPAVLRAAGFRHLELQDLDDDQIGTFIDGWFRLIFPNDPREVELRRRRLARARRSGPVRLLAGNPMLLTIMVLIARLQELPRERWRFYDYAAEVLCHHWEVNRHLEEEGFKDYVGLEEKRELLRRIASRMQEGEGGIAGNLLTERDLRAEISAYLRHRFDHPQAEAERLARKLMRQLRERNYILCLRGPRLYGFLHRTFLEYFCALDLVETLNKDPAFTIERIRDEVFAEHWRDPEWREVLRLVCGMVGEANAKVLLAFFRDGAHTGPYWSSNEAPFFLPIGLQCMSEVRDLRPVQSEALDLARSFCASLVHSSVYVIDDYGDFFSEDVLLDILECKLPPTAAKSLEDDVADLLSDVNVSSLGLTLARCLARWLGHSSSARAQLLGVIARYDDDAWGAEIALDALSIGWRDEDTRRLLEDFITKGNSSLRDRAIGALGRGWPDDVTRKLLTERAFHDESSKVRSTALVELAERWSDETTRAYLEERTRDDEEGDVRRASLEKLARGWPDEATRRLLTNHARSDPHEYVRRASLEELARGWPDEATRELLTNYACLDPHEHVRYASLEELARGWPEERTRALLEGRAMEDSQVGVRYAAAEALSKAWPGETTDELLRWLSAREEETRWTYDFTKLMHNPGA